VGFSTAPEAHTAPTALVVVGLLVGCSLMAWRLAAWSLSADKEGLVVRNFCWSRRIPWSRVSAFEDAWVQDEGGTHWVLKIVLDDGSSVRSTATSGHPSEVEALGRLALRYGVRVPIEPC